MKTDKKILLDWAATYGEDKYDVRASMYGEDLMIEFAKYYHTEQLNLFGVSRSLKEKYKKGFFDSSQTTVSFETVSLLKSFKKALKDTLKIPNM
jgi:hypothetical protein